MLVSAPAGFGKTTLLVDWMAAVSDAPGSDTATAWLSLDAGDNDPATYWTYVIAALRTVAPDLGADALALLQDPQPPPIQVVLTTLLNDLGAVEHDIVLLLDDYHVIASPEVHTGMEFLVDHLPPRVHVVMASRADPALPLARLRARGELVEVRAADLRFTADEAASYLNDSMGLQLTPKDVTALEERTEGWIAALQLAALSMTGRDDAASFIAGFAGDDRYVVDYLVEEVLQRQPEHIESFLLQTSVLDRMNGPLCDALTGQEGGRAVLETLDRDNLFLVPLDDRRRWYRYHHLFADVLKARLLDGQPGRVGELHRLASRWYEENGDRAEAVRHALSGGDFDIAATLMEREMPVLRRDRREATIRGWLETLPDDVLRVRPVLCNALAGALMSTGTFEGVEGLLDSTEQWLGTDATGSVVVDEDEFRRLPAEVAVHRAGLALLRGDVDGTFTFARRALALVQPGDDPLAHGAASALQGLAAWTSGDLELAQTSYAASLVDFEGIDHISDVLGCAFTLADIQVARGRLREAMRTYDEALALASRHGNRALRGAVGMHVGRAALHREFNDLTAARSELVRSRELGEHAGLPADAYRWRVVMAQVCEVEGDVEASIRLLDEAERIYDGDFSPDVRPIPAVRARTWIRQGQLDHASAWGAQSGLSVTDDVSYVHEFEHLTLARLLEAGQSLELMARLLRAAEEEQRSGSVIEIRIVEALVHHSRGDVGSALSSLEAALDLAEPVGYVRTFLDEGAPMTALLTAAAASGSASPYIRRLLAAAGGASMRPAPTHPMIETLSSRERDVLRLLATELNGPEIARELVVSLNTVRTHTKNLYMKLGVNSRQAALGRARELGLL